MEQPRILIIDPSSDWNAALKSKLQDKYRVRTACNGEAGWELMQGFLPDMVILDVMLPGMDGISLLRHCAMLFPPSPSLGSATSFPSPACRKM